MVTFKRPRLCWNIIPVLRGIQHSEFAIPLYIIQQLRAIMRNYRGQTALMQACQHGHGKAVLTLVLFGANIHKADYLNGGIALHLAALNGHTRCIRLLLSDYIPSIPNCWSLLTKLDQELISEFDHSLLSAVINKTADGGITALHMAALNGHVESVRLLLDLGASVTEVTVEELHYCRGWICN